MTGLQWEIEKQKKFPRAQRKISIPQIAEMFHYTYPTAKSKVENGSFTVNEALAIMSLFFDDYSIALEEYLFTDIENYKITGKKLYRAYYK